MPTVDVASHHHETSFLLTSRVLDEVADAAGITAIITTAAIAIVSIALCLGMSPSPARVRHRGSDVLRPTVWHPRRRDMTDLDHCHKATFIVINDYGYH